MLNSFYEIEKQNVCDADSIINAIDIHDRPVQTEVKGKCFQ